MIPQLLDGEHKMEEDKTGTILPIAILNWDHTTSLEGHQ